MKKTILIASLFAAAAASAEWTPAMISLVTPVQAPANYYDVRGLRLSLIYGECSTFKGLDIGIVGYTEGLFKGVGIGGVNIAGEQLMGCHIGLVNWNANARHQWGQRSVAAQVGAFNYAGGFCGLQDGIVNVSENAFAGLQSAFVNISRDLQGVQMGQYFIFGVNLVNGEMSGCQIGLVNYAERVREGLQIGIVNIINENGWLAVLPIVNGHF